MFGVFIAIVGAALHTMFTFNLIQSDEVNRRFEAILYTQNFAKVIISMLHNFALLSPTQTKSFDLSLAL